MLRKMQYCERMTVLDTGQKHQAKNLQVNKPRAENSRQKKAGAKAGDFFAAYSDTA